ncbi:MAG: hypothetical protein HPY82_18705 [Gammaproteobacteria bacterium]|nr:hypothetical protein [Gammaproteobacteria bacterium]
MSFRRRTYPEVMENVLTGLTGGIAAESHAYPPAGAKTAPYAHALEHPPVDAIISVYGIRNNQTFQFVKGSDYELKQDKLVWLEKANTPDAGTLLHINYRSKGAQSPFNDLHVGSVLRTLAESFSLELAGLYAQAEAVYKSAFIDTAEGRSLDNVVALLDVNRVRAGRNTTKVKFSRSANGVGDIHIPAGTRVTNADASVQFETIAAITLLDGQTSVQVDARDIADNLEALPADSLVILTKPLAGIDSVTNPNPSSVLERDETDDELRTRAKNFLHGSEKATLGAIKHAIAQQNVVAEVSENDPEPGKITVTVHSDNLTPETEQRLLAAIKDARPAGIEVILAGVSAPFALDLELRISTAADLLEADLRGIQERAVQRIMAYLNGSAIGDTISLNRIVGLVLSDNTVLDVRILSARVGSDDVLDRDQGIIKTDNISGVTPGSKVALRAGAINIIDPALATVLSASLRFPVSAAAPSESVIRAALASAIEAINLLNASELPASPTPPQLRQRQLNYGKLLAVIPLPGKPAVTSYNDVAGLDDASLPTSSAAGDYQVQFIVTSESGISHLLEDETSPAVTLIPFERLTLANVELKAQAEVTA